jgi:hypothetical protein
VNFTDKSTISSSDYIDLYLWGLPAIKDQNYENLFCEPLSKRLTLPPILDMNLTSVQAIVTFANAAKVAGKAVTAAPVFFAQCLSFAFKGSMNEMLGSIMSMQGLVYIPLTKVELPGPP